MLDNVYLFIYFFIPSFNEMIISNCIFMFTQVVFVFYEILFEDLKQSSVTD